MIVSKRKETFHRILWMKKMTTYRFVNPQLHVLKAVPGLVQNRKKSGREKVMKFSISAESGICGKYGNLQTSFPGLKNVWKISKNGKWSGIYTKLQQVLDC